MNAPALASARRLGSSGEVGIGQFVKITLVNERIDGVFAGEGRARHRQVGPGRYEPRARRKRLVTVTQPIDQRDREPATRTVSTNRNVLGCNVLLAQEALGGHRVVQRRGELVLGRQPIAWPIHR
jgi:hypothetical protein